MKVGRRILHALLIVLTLAVGATAAAAIVTQTAWFRNFLRGTIEQQAGQFLNGELSIGRLDGNLFFGVELGDIEVSMDGSPVVSVAGLGADYSLFGMIAGGLSVEEVRIRRPALSLRREGDTWSIARLLKPQESDPDGPPLSLAVHAIAVHDGSVVVHDPGGVAGLNVPRRIDGLEGALSYRSGPEGMAIGISNVSFRASEPDIALAALSGAVIVEETALRVRELALRTDETELSVDGTVGEYLTQPALDMRVASRRLSLPEISRVVPALSGVLVQPSFDLRLEGPLDRLAVAAEIRSAAGNVTARVVADVLAPTQSVTGEVSLSRLNLAGMLDGQAATDLTADIRADLSADDFADLDSLSGTLSLKAPRVAFEDYRAEGVSADLKARGRQLHVDARGSAYGATVTANGEVTVPAADAPLAYDLRGRIEHVDLSRLPRALAVPPADTDVSAAYAVQGREPLASDATAGGRRVSGDLVFAASTVAGATIAEGSTAGGTMEGDRLSYRADATIAGVNLRRFGQAFEVAALADEQYESTINADIEIEGRGTSPKAMVLTAAGVVSDASLLGGRIPTLTFDADVADDRATVKAKGRFADVDPSVAGRRPELQGSVAGSLDVDARIARLSEGVTAESVAAGVRLTLEPSAIGGLRIDRAVVAGDYANLGGDIRELELAGPDLQVSGRGRLALDDAGQSDLRLQLGTPSLGELGKLASLAVGGIVRVDARVTGNRSLLQVAGTVSGDGVSYGEDASVLALRSDFTAGVPEFDVDQATVTARTTGASITVAGQEVDEIEATVTYAARQVDFDAVARQPRRSVNVGGVLTLLPDAQEVRLRRLALDSGEVRWELVPGSGPITYRENAVTVRGLELASGDQRITAEGTFGRADESLAVGVNAVDLAAVDALLLREPQLSGRLQATASLAGTTAEPRVAGEFRIDQGAFQDFRYEALSGTLQYASDGITVDTRLQQNAAQWFTAKGFLPASIFGGSGDEGATAAADAAAQMDLTIDSSPIDLGVVQGFTSAVSGVRGTIEAHVRVTGTATEPRPEGVITIQNGALTVAATGTSYRNIGGRLDLQPDRLHIDSITVLDDQYNPLSVTGDLAIDRQRVQGVQLYVTASDFKVIDSALGRMKVEGSLEVSGDLLEPRVQGYLGLNSGELNLDEILALVGDMAYATEETAGPAEGVDTEPAAPGVFDGLTMDVQVILPNALIVRADSLQAPGSSVGLGALDLTLGGSLSATKDKGDTIRLRGAVNTVRGYYDFQGRRFEILRDGSVRFLGLEQMNPTLDIRTRRTIQGVDTYVNVRGSLIEPEIVLASVPPLEEADILSLIVFNQPVNALGAGEQVTLAQRAQALAAGAVAGQLAESIGNVLNVDTFEINMAPEAGRGPEVTIGQQVGDNIYVRLQQGVGDQSTTNLILEYQLTRWLRLQTNVLQGSSAQQSLFRRAQGSGIDLIFFFSY